MSVISRRAFDVRLVETQRGELQWARYRSLNVEWNSTSRGLLFARDGVLLVAHCSRDELMNIVLIAIGCILRALGLMMAANRSGYVYFVVGPRSVLVVAGVVAVLAFWILQTVPR
jgi:1,4-dihydroxy-2-naphthoate octaprenyltransferase